jgi:nucleoside-diphosphate-sugar epimerase
VAPVSLYAETKLKTEQGILSLADDDFSPCVLRLSTVYGISPRMRFDLVVNLFILNALTAGKLTVFGGEQWRPYVHVLDVARAFIHALRADKNAIHRQIFNVGSQDQNHRVIDLAKMVAEEIEGTEIIHNPDAKDQRNYYVAFDKIRQKLNFTSKSNIKTGIREIKEAFQAGAFHDFKDKKYSNMRQQEHLIFG